MTLRYCSSCKRRLAATFGWLKTCPGCKAKQAARRVPKYVRNDAEAAPLVLEGFLPMGAPDERRALVWKVAA